MTAARFVLGILVVLAFVGILITADWFVKAVTSYVPVLP